MSQSPPSTLYDRRNGEPRSRTLPRTGARAPGGAGAPEGAGGAGERGAGKCASSPTELHRAAEEPQYTHYLFAVHRKQVRSDAYFLPWQRRGAALFGAPALVPLAAGAPARRLYAAVWAQLARLLSARPAADRHNHATDCDDSLGYEFPFTLRAVDGAGAWCARCGWPALCRGCALPADGRPLLLPAAPRPPEPEESDTHARTYWSTRGHAGGSPGARTALQRRNSGRDSFDDEGRAGETEPGEISPEEFTALVHGGRGLLLAVDWEPTALHLRYQTAREKACAEHASVAACRRAAASAVDLASCLRAFTSEERLEQRYRCAACRAAQPATKKLQLWRAPPVLIIHLKRFQYVNNKWIKSQKVVNFPFHDFDPTPYLASVPQETILRHKELSSRRKSSLLVDVEEPISESESEDEIDEGRAKPVPERKRREPAVRGRKRLESSSLATTPVQDDNLVDYHKHHLVPEQDPFDLKYRLYAVVSHTGQLSGGHYVCYARHPSGAWLCYNDSSCRALAAPAVDPAAAYLLFYERQGLRAAAYLPRAPVRCVATCITRICVRIRK
ncbi:ubiquitin carboxyl-terminal hydrolase 32-like [Zerene cesonia]|uniref:ubiquitin carboxyl-terminal hydrolase 32-like n=1 Tax=Zerene cesonia TaxID=33412 RepID=UPI0018E55849|nr:ubiquitin carboxyl-terminal hydrolase 32-like [Zerene cesonia]